MASDGWALILLLGATDERSNSMSETTNDPIKHEDEGVTVPAQVLVASDAPNADVGDLEIEVTTISVDAGQFEESGDEGEDADQDEDESDIEDGEGEDADQDEGESDVEDDEGEDADQDEDDEDA